MQNLICAAPANPILYLGRFDDTNARYNRQIGNLQAGFKNQELAFFGQDQWRISSKLSINYGLRGEQQYNPEAEVTTLFWNVVQNTVFPIYGKSFTPGIPDSGWQWGPRLGFAYDVLGDGKTVVRGYAGIYYARTPGLLFVDSVNNYCAIPRVTSALRFRSPDLV
ncbi:MAG: TonB-dependent receptor [Acidobacteria bacterium]|nr:TonB-dependent receptor [Acidobacteriota bacterium]